MVQIVHQDSYASLNPLRTVDQTLRDIMIYHKKLLRKNIILIMFRILILLKKRKKKQVEKIMELIIHGKLIKVEKNKNKVL